MASMDRVEHEARTAFIVTIDTEGDDLWGVSREISVRNAPHILRFQRLCESHGIRPTYLTDYEMVTCGEWQELGSDIIKRNVGEIGMHLHAWHSPPQAPLTSDDYRHHPYLIEYPLQIMEDKISFLTALLEDTFGTKMISHRAGRFGFNESYAALLLKYGYRVDCSVTPRVSWQKTPGDPSRKGGPNFTRCPESPYFVNLNDIGKPGDSGLLEVPVSIVKKSPFFFPFVYQSFRRIPFARHVIRRLFFDISWLQPNGANLGQILQIVRSAVAHGKPHLEFILHSSELMPGGSPTFPTDRDIQILYEHLEELFSLASGICRPMTLRDYHSEFVAAIKTSPLDGVL